MEGSVLGSKILPAILIVVPVTVLLTAQACLSEPAAEECISRPTAVTPRGAHWYYRIDRAKQHCWYLGKADGLANASAVTSATPTSASAPQHGNAAEAPAADAPEATSPPVAPAATAFAPAALHKRRQRKPFPSRRSLSRDRVSALRRAGRKIFRTPKI
jgi:hypothetical protein